MSPLIATHYAYDTETYIDSAVSPYPGTALVAFIPLNNAGTLTSPRAFDRKISTDFSSDLRSDDSISLFPPDYRLRYGSVTT